MGGSPEKMCTNCKNFALSDGSFPNIINQRHFVYVRNQECAILADIRRHISYESWIEVFNMPLWAYFKTLISVTEGIGMYFGMLQTI